MKLFSSKRGQVNATGVTTKVITLVVFAGVLSATIPIALTFFTNLSLSGIGLSALFGSTFIGLLFGAFAIQIVLKMLK